jgi:hypothetical protein
MDRVFKTLNNPHGNSIYHLATEPVRVRWKIRNIIESSINELDEHQRYKVTTLLFGSSPHQPSNLRMSNGNLNGMIGQ